MSERLALPEIFKGGWENLLIVTYGADIPFFENAILRSNFTCRNKIILSDGKKFQIACERYAQDHKVRMLNQTYVADGIFVQKAAHAKAILLLNHDEGRLHIGSGNLGIQGYTSGGEMFTSFAYNPKDQNAIQVFQYFWDFIDTLLKRGVIGGASETFIRKMYEDTPWLMQNSKKTWQPLRHNLNSSLMDQVKQEVNGEKVQELWVLSPFFDEKALALSTLIETFNPTKVNLVIQPKYVSIEKNALEKVIKKYKGKIKILPFESLLNNKSESFSAYVHAKLFLFKTKNRSICLQGSPNCSKAALILTSAFGNIELANLLTGPKDSFDKLFQALNLLPALDSARSLNLKFDRPDKPNTTRVEETWLVTGARWHNDRFYLYFLKEIPDLAKARIQLGDIEFSLSIVRREGKVVEVKLPQSAIEALSAGPLPIRLVIGNKTSSFIFPYNMDALARETHGVQDGVISRNFDKFDPDDDEFEHLLLELSASFPLDRRSIWQLTNQPIPDGGNEENDEGLQIKYIDIDFELLRKHPKIQQYLHRGLVGDHPTHLQEVLNSITSHFQGLTDTAYKKPTPNEEGEDDSEETNRSEEEDGVEDKPHKAVRRNQRQRILKRFIGRYLRGIRSKDFIELVGVDVIVNNYIIFSHILWKLLQKDWLKLDFVIGAILQMWGFFWGDDADTGYLSKCDKKDQLRAQALLKERKSYSIVMACLFLGDYKCSIDGEIDLRLQLRDFWRIFLTKPPVEINSDIILDTWVYVHEALPFASYSPGYIVLALEILSRLDTSEDFLFSLDEHLGLPDYSCRFVVQEIFRPSIDKQNPLECLEIASHKAIKDKNDALFILALWMRFSKREFYRISNPNYILLYDTAVKNGEFYNKVTGATEEIGPQDVLEKEKWQVGMAHILNIAKIAEKSISMRLTEILQTTGSKKK